ncbi:NAD-dependent epimerase [Spirochaetia bacterium]|nr:NAD-dependent epimerase [Spirochaetia bacterium]
MKLLITGSAGFISGYLVEELLKHGHYVVGIDNFSKYGKVKKSYDDNPNYDFYEGDVKDTELMKSLVKDCDQIVAIAAMIGGTAYFHTYPYDIMAENEKIIASTFDAALAEFKRPGNNLKKITMFSSSLVFERAVKFPNREEDVLFTIPPMSAYAFQKLTTEYWCRAASDQYGLPYTIIRPCNCAGIGEKKALIDPNLPSGNINMALGHVIPDIVKKIAFGQDPLHILGTGKQTRHFTYAGDIADGVVKSIESENSVNEDFNIVTETSTSILDLAMNIWRRINGDRPFTFVSDEAFKYDQVIREPSNVKAKELLGFEAKTTLDQILDEVVPWVQEQIKK